MTLGNRIAESREKLKMTQQELALVLDLSPQYISAVEKGKKIPSLTQTIRIARALGTSVSYLVDDMVHGDDVEIWDTMSAIKRDKELSQKSKKALTTLIEELRQRSGQD